LKTTSSNSLQSKNEEENGEKEGEEEEEEDNKASLLETVAEYQAKRASTHPATTIQGDTSTGEENEITKFQVENILACLFYLNNSNRWRVNCLCTMVNNNNLLNVVMEY
jgi:hypothetical protein